MLNVRMHTGSGYILSFLSWPIPGINTSSGQTRHFTSIDFVRSLESCFQALGGCPAQLVIDQDRLMVVSENYGDIIFTQEFERCKFDTSLDFYVCRKGDPESKGMVESGVKYVKYNFARVGLCQIWHKGHRILRLGCSGRAMAKFTRKPKDTG